MFLWYGYLRNSRDSMASNSREFLMFRQAKSSDIRQEQGDNGLLRIILEDDPPFDTIDPETLVLIGYSDRNLINQIVGCMIAEDGVNKGIGKPLQTHRCYNALVKMSGFFAAWDTVASALECWKPKSSDFVVTKKSAWLQTTQYEKMHRWLQILGKCLIERHAMFMSTKPSNVIVEESREEKSTNHEREKEDPEE